MRFAALLGPERRIRIARIWLAVSALLLLVRWHQQMAVGWTDGVDRPFGEDYLNFWSGAKLALSGQVHTLYRIDDYHRFQVETVGHSIDLYHYSYPPTLALILAPFALLSYPVSWVAWQGAGWAAFATALKRFMPGNGILLALTWPAVFINAVAGQTGCWLAGVTGWGLILLPTRPVIAGLILSLFTIKPQLGWLLPFALLAGREWKALLGFVIGCVLLISITTGTFGMGLWWDYARQATLLKVVILENGAFVWMRMISLFVLVRHMGAPLPIAYGAQAVASAIALLLVVVSWRRAAVDRLPLLMIAMLASAIYVSDYDCVLLAYPAAMLWPAAKPGVRVLLGVAALMPLFAAGLALITGIALGALVLWLLLIYAASRKKPPKILEGAARPGLPSSTLPRVDTPEIAIVTH
jgi:hypothetical protein